MATKKINLATYRYDTATFNPTTDVTLLRLARSRGFNDPDNPYVKLFNKRYFHYPRLNFKKELPQSTKVNVLPYINIYMDSPIAKHEHKQMICAMLLNELVDIGKDNA